MKFTVVFLYFTISTGPHERFCLSLSRIQQFQQALLTVLACCFPIFRNSNRPICLFQSVVFLHFTIPTGLQIYFSLLISYISQFQQSLMLILACCFPVFHNSNSLFIQICPIVPNRISSLFYSTTNYDLSQAGKLYVKVYDSTDRYSRNARLSF